MTDFKSAFAAKITDFIAEKHSLGYKYEVDMYVLKQFDAFCLEKYPAETLITREIMIEWAALRKYEHPGTLTKRVTTIREFTKYLARMGFSVFMLPPNFLPKTPHYTPYIYSNDELKRYFFQADKIDKSGTLKYVPYKHLVLPMFFRLLYACGMRSLEASLIKLGEVDIENGIITINNAKNKKIRQLPISAPMLEQVKFYCSQIHKDSPSNAWFFPYFDGGNNPVRSSMLGRNHRELLRKSGIPYCGKSHEAGKPGGPRMHDFRHTFAVHCLRRWALEGKDIHSMLPYLQTYMGHVSISATAYYLHLTSEIFPQITKQLEKSFGSIIPEIPTEVSDDNY